MNRLSTQEKTRSVRLGPFELEHPFLLAPMAGITNSPFRRLMRRSQSALVISELISANGIHFKSQRTYDLMKFQEDERILGIQIFGEDKNNLVEACQYIEQLGADFIDLNLGCPVTKVVKKGAGSALCRKPPELQKILEAMVNSVRLPVTIKIRTGWTDQTRNADEVVQAAYDAGVSWVAIHGRSRAQAYKGQSDWDYIAEVKSKSPLPIIGNGDVLTPEQAVARYEESGVDAVMIGRAALRNPFIFQQSSELWQTGAYNKIQYEAYLDLLASQRELLSQLENDRIKVLQSKKFLAWYSAGFRESSEFRGRLFKMKNFEEVWDDGFRFFEESTHQRDMSFLTEDFLMGGHG